MATSLELRKTHTYVGTYKHEDKWEYLGTITSLQRSEKCTDEEDPCQPTTIINHIKVDLDKRDHSAPVWSDADIKQAIKDTLTTVGCHHEYDCCGCWSSHVSEVLPLTRQPGEYIIIQHASRNY